MVVPIRKKKIVLNTMGQTGITYSIPIEIEAKMVNNVSHYSSWINILLCI
jgi:hypothetical protein